MQVSGLNCSLTPAPLEVADGTELLGGTWGRVVCKNRTSLKTVLIQERSQRLGWAPEAARGGDAPSLGSAELVILSTSPGSWAGAQCRPAPPPRSETRDPRGIRSELGLAQGWRVSGLGRQGQQEVQEVLRP